VTIFQYWRVNLLVLLGGVFVLLPQYTHSASCNTAESFVRAYYGDLERNDVDSVRAKWARPHKWLIQAVKQFAGARVDETSLSNCTGRKADVYIDVTMKVYNKRSERWTGEISLNSVQGHWKIRNMRLSVSKRNCGQNKENLLAYQDRGDRCEGIKPQLVGGYDIELISAIVNHYEREVANSLPDFFKLKFCLPPKYPRDINVKVREFEPEHYYWMTEPEISLGKGCGNFFQWPTRTVIQKLDGLKMPDLGVVARLQSTTNQKAEHVAPVLFYHTSAPTSINGYRFAFKVGGSAKLSYAVYQSNSRQPLLRQELGKQTGGKPFAISWDSSKAPAGDYKLVVKGYFLDSYRKIRQDVHFYHQPIFDSASQVKDVQPPVQVTPPDKFQQQPNIQSAIERYPTIKCPDKVKPGQKFPVVISLPKNLITSQKNFGVNPFLKVSSKNLHSVSKSTKEWS